MYKKIISLLTIGFLFAYCSTSPTKSRVSELDSIEIKGKSVFTISIPHLTEASEVGAFTSGLTLVTGSMKVLPTVPEDIKAKTKELVDSTLTESNSTVETIITVANKLGKFDYLLLVTSEEADIATVIFGIPISSQKGMLVKTKLYDASVKAFVSQASVPSITAIPAGIPDADKAKLAIISDAARKGVTTLIKK
ncbi:MAG: hypothetical protein SH817_11885 [Leptospira sp.]|nr:hypothetical protein [Leptospira sp.]